MPSSESEDFESADEGPGSVEKRERKKRNSSSNYSDNALENAPTPLHTPPVAAKKVPHEEKQNKETDGWDDFDIDDNEKPSISASETSSKNKITTDPTSNKTEKNMDNTKDTGWDDFDDWGDSNDNEEDLNKPQSKEVKEITDRLAATSTTPTSSWGWGGWGVDSLLSTATAGISTITNQVSQGISTVLETGIGIPDPEELAKQKAKDKDSITNEMNKPEGAKGTEDVEQRQGAEGSGDGAFAFGNILKFVGDTGSRVITGGLDTLETIGRKTMEVLQEGDPGLERKKRAMMGFFDPDKPILSQYTEMSRPLDTLETIGRKTMEVLQEGDPGLERKKRAMIGFFDPDKPILSQVLREAKSKAEEDDKIKEEKREAKEVHYENLFDDFEGLVHLEALEMLSKQASMRIEERVQSATPNDRQDMKETLQQVAELCEMPDDEEDDDNDDDPSSDLSKSEAFFARLQKATKDLGVMISFQPLVKQYEEILAYTKCETSDFSDKAMYKKAISSLAQATALSVEIYHKTAEMLLVKPRRSTANEVDGLSQLTVVLTKHMNDIATLFTQEMDERATYVNANECNNYMTNIFLEAENSAKYIQNAFQLTQPIIQIGAI